LAVLEMVTGRVPHPAFGLPIHEAEALSPGESVWKFQVRVPFLQNWI